VSPLLDLQVRFRELGRIRAGEKGSKGEPRKLEHFRLTSASEPLLTQAATLFGGEVREWKGAPDEGMFELYTTTSRLDVMIPPVADAGALLSQHYELWSGGGCVRRCDGVNEQLSGKPCLCDAADRTCKPTTRLSVMLPALGGIGVWRLDTGGINAALELPGAFGLIVRAAEGQFMPAILRLEQRSKREQGTTKRYVVPVLDMEQATMLELVSGEVSVGVLGPVVATGRPALPPAGDPPEGEAAVFVDTWDGSPTHGEPPPLPDAEPVEPQTPGLNDRSLTKAQGTKLNVLVGKLRDEREAITTANLYAALASTRDLDAETLIALVEGRDEEGELHWSPLRESLSRSEASALIERLQAKENELAERALA
jgi:hypothetical protein